jgi:hypothetical protein
MQVDPTIARLQVQAEERLQFAVQSLIAANEKATADPGDELAAAWRHQAIREAEDALCMAYELGMDL